jgi:hypothetical protein
MRLLRAKYIADSRNRRCGSVHKRMPTVYFGDAAEQLPFETAEGGYQGRTWTTYELLFEELELQLPRDTALSPLASDLSDAVSDQIWCDYDWLRLDLDDALSYSWEYFCRIVKSERRYFFTEVRHSADDDQDILTPSQMLKKIGSITRQLGLLKTAGAGSKFFRARKSWTKRLSTAAELGPPPEELSLQANRMNPPGIPMFYGASSAKAALREIQSFGGYVGEFVALRDLRILDLSYLPNIPSIFSGKPREQRLTLAFLRQFQRSVSAPVPRDERVHVEYVPTQIITEYFRYLGVGAEDIDGITYDSVASVDDTNTVLFIGRGEISGIDERYRHSATAKRLGLAKSYFWWEVPVEVQEAPRRVIEWARRLWFRIAIRWRMFRHRRGRGVKRPTQ